MKTANKYPTLRISVGGKSMSIEDYLKQKKGKNANLQNSQQALLTAPVEKEKAIVKTINVTEQTLDCLAKELEIASDTAVPALLKPSINVDLFYRNQAKKQGQKVEDEEKLKWYYKQLLATTNHYYDTITGKYKGFYDALEEQPFCNFEGNIVLCKDGEMFFGDGDKEKAIMKQLVPFNFMCNPQHDEWNTTNTTDEKLIPAFINEYIKPLVAEQNVILRRPHRIVQSVKVAIIRSIVNAGYLYKSLDYYKNGLALFNKICSDIGLDVAAGFRVTDSEVDKTCDQFVNELKAFIAIKYGRVLNIVETICAGDAKKFDRLAVVWAKIYIGRDCLKSAFDIESANALVLTTSNTFYLKQFIAAAFDFDGKHGNKYNHAPYCLQLKDMRASERISNVITVRRILRLKKVDQSVSFFSLSELGEKNIVPKLLMSKLNGNLLNVSLQDTAGECDFKRLKQLFNGNEITYNNKIFGEQTYHANNFNCIIASPDSKIITELKGEGVTPDTIAFANNIPVNQAAFGDGQTLTQEEILFINFVLAMWGTHCLLNGETFEVDNAESKVFAEFVDDCCDVVPVEEPTDSKANLTPTASNGTAWATVEAMYKIYHIAATGQEFIGKINRDFCDCHNIKTNIKQQRCKEIIQRDYNKGYREELGELPKDGPSNFCIGLIIKPKTIVMGKCKDKTCNRLKPASENMRKQFYKRFGEAIAITVSELNKGIH